MFNLFGKNDWYPVWTVIEKWGSPSTGWVQYSNFEILHSESRNEYKLKVSGFQPKMASKYSIAVQKLKEK